MVAKGFPSIRTVIEHAGSICERIEFATLFHRSVDIISQRSKQKRTHHLMYMNRSRSSLPALLLLLTFTSPSSWTVPSSAQEPANKSTETHLVSASAKAAIQAADEEWLPAMQRGDAETIAAPYADDGVFVTKAGETIRGRSAIRDFYRTRLKSIAHITGQLVQESLVTSGSLVYEWGHASTTVELKDGTRRSGGGAYLTVWQETSPGRWQIIRNLVF